MAAPRLPFNAPDGSLLYEWEQGLDEVHVYVKPPAGTRGRDVDVTVTVHRLRLGLRGSKPLVDGELAGVVVADESTWMLEDGELHVLLVKAHKGETWPSVYAGHSAMDAATHTATQKRMLLERFSSEHPGFDFSGADVTGSVPDPRTFMGGIKH